MARTQRRGKQPPSRTTAADHEAKIAATLRGMNTSLRRKRHFIGYGVGRKTTGGKRLTGLAAILFVDTKVPVHRLKPKDLLPAEIRVGKAIVRTDVIELSPIKLLGNPAENQKRRRPLKGGVSISVCPNRDDRCPGFGTGGALVADVLKTHYLLSAAHVMKLHGEDLIQPGSLHGGHNHERKLIGYKRGKPVYQYKDPKDNVGGVVRIAPAGIDAAAAEIIQMTPTQIGLAAPQSPAGVVVDLPVQKSGAATGVTSGTCAVSNINLQAGTQKIIATAMVKAKVPGWKKTTNMNGLFFVSPGTFGDAGDSGSLIVAGGSTAADKRFLKQNGIDNSAALGLLIAYINTGTQQYIVGQDINLGLNALQVSLVI